MTEVKKDETKDPKGQQDAALIGAKAVADAVSKVAEAAVAEVQKASVSIEPPEVIVSATPGGSFELRPGKATLGFGSSGTVTFSGHQVKTTEWSTQRIVGQMPSEAPPPPELDSKGVPKVKSETELEKERKAHEADVEVVVHIDDKTKRVGTFKR